MSRVGWDATVKDAKGQPLALYNPKPGQVDVCQDGTAEVKVSLQVLRDLMHKEHVSVSELARRMHVGRSYVSRRLSGETRLDARDLFLMARLVGYAITQEWVLDVSTPDALLPDLVACVCDENLPLPVRLLVLYRAIDTTIKQEDASALSAILDGLRAVVGELAVPIAIMALRLTQDLKVCHTARRKLFDACSLDGRQAAASEFDRLPQVHEVDTQVVAV